MTFIEMASKCITPLHSRDLFNLNVSEFLSFYLIDIYNS